MEGSFPLITCHNSDKVVSSLQINLSDNAGSSRGIQEISSEGKQILILLGNVIKGTVIHTEAEGTIFLFDEQNRGSMG
jgi:hypothetical protein